MNTTHSFEDFVLVMHVSVCPIKCTVFLDANQHIWTTWNRVCEFKPTNMYQFLAMYCPYSLDISIQSNDFRHRHEFVEWICVIITLASANPYLYIILLTGRIVAYFIYCGGGGLGQLSERRRAGCRRRRRAACGRRRAGSPCARGRQAFGVARRIRRQRVLCLQFSRTPRLHTRMCTMMARFPCQGMSALLPCLKA